MLSSTEPRFDVLRTLTPREEWRKIYISVETIFFKKGKVKIMYVKFERQVLKL